MVILIGISDSVNKESVEVDIDLIFPLAKRRSNETHKFAIDFMQTTYATLAG